MTVRKPKAAVIGAALALIAACSSTGHEKVAALPLTPKPTRPGQVVILAGNDAVRGDPTDGAYAVRTHIEPIGGLAAAPDGSVYVVVRFGSDGRIAHITNDGRLHLMGEASEGDQLVIQGRVIWQMSNALSGMLLSHIDLVDGKKKDYVAWNEQEKRRINVVDTSGRKLPEKSLKDLDTSWGGSVVGIRWDGVPVIANTSGQLFEVVGQEKLREWTPPGYSDAVSKAKGANALRVRPDLLPTALLSVPGEHGLLVISPYGFVHVTQDKPAMGIKFATSRSGREVGYTSTGAVRLDNGQIILVGPSTTVENGFHILSVQTDGAASITSWGDDKECKDFDGRMDAISSGGPTGIVRRTDGTFIVADSLCGRVYDFVLPHEIPSKPFS